MSSSVVVQAWYVDLGAAALAFLAADTAELEAPLRAAARAQAAVYALRADLLAEALAELRALGGANEVLAGCLAADDLERRKNLPEARRLFEQLRRERGALGAWAGLRLVGVLSKLGERNKAAMAYSMVETNLEASPLLLTMMEAAISTHPGAKRAKDLNDALAQHADESPKPILALVYGELARLTVGWTDAHLQRKRALELSLELGDLLGIAEHAPAAIELALSEQRYDDAEALLARLEEARQAVLAAELGSALGEPSAEALRARLDASRQRSSTLNDALQDARVLEQRPQALARALNALFPKQGPQLAEKLGKLQSPHSLERLLQALERSQLPEHAGSVEASDFELFLNQLCQREEEERVHRSILRAREEESSTRDALSELVQSLCAPALHGELLRKLDGLELHESLVQLLDSIDSAVQARELEPLPRQLSAQMDLLLMREERGKEARLAEQARLQQREQRLQALAKAQATPSAAAVLEVLEGLLGAEPLQRLTPLISALQQDASFVSLAELIERALRSDDVMGLAADLDAALEGLLAQERYQRELPQLPEVLAKASESGSADALADAARRLLGDERGAPLIQRLACLAEKGSIERAAAAFGEALARCDARSIIPSLAPLLDMLIREENVRAREAATKRMAEVIKLLTHAREEEATRLADVIAAMDLLYGAEFMKDAGPKFERLEHPKSIERVLEVIEQAFGRRELRALPENLHKTLDELLGNEGSKPAEPVIELPDDFPTLALVEKEHIKKALYFTRKDLARAAAVLGVSLEELQVRMQRHGLD
ncbi:MAG: hypothetical protein RBU37_23515 [Myxococcota bacterium]|jgi:hypothetical protein|nr:hypothetical protein [Myxococcota bacterium]